MKPHTHKCIDPQHEGKASLKCWRRPCNVKRTYVCSTCEARRMYHEQAMQAFTQRKLNG